MKDPRNFYEKCRIHPGYCKRAKPLFDLVFDNEKYDKDNYQYDEGTCEDCEWYETMDEDGYVLDEYDTDEGVDFFGWNSEW